MKAIQIKWLPQTNFLPARVKAFTEGGNKITVQFQYELCSESNAIRAANALIDKMDWDVVLGAIGVLPNGDYVGILHSRGES